MIFQKNFRMATFKIHEDFNNFNPTNKFERFAKNKVLHEKQTQNGFKHRKPFGSNENNVLQSQKSFMEVSKIINK